MISDLEYINGLQQENPKVYASFVKKYTPRIYNTSLGILQDRQEAEEVAQDVFIKIFQSIHRFDKKSSLNTWVYRITVNKALDALRSRKRKSFFLTFMGDQLNEQNAVNFVHPGILLEQQENAMVLFKSLNRLPERQKVVFILHKLEDLSYAEIAETLQLSTAAVDSLMSRAKANLKEILKSIIL